jgi:hypothetical protein
MQRPDCLVPWFPGAWRRSATVNIRKRAASLRLLTAAVILTGSLTAAALAADGSSAGGHGNTISGGELRTFSFSVVRHANGTVTGNVQVKDRALDVRVHSIIDCVKFEAGNRAIMSGPITESSDPALVVPGRIAVFGVEDNGEGAAAAPDRITTVPDFAPPKSCDEFTFVGDTLREIVNPGVTVRVLVPISNGNIQVQR